MRAIGEFGFGPSFTVESALGPASRISGVYREYHATEIALPLNGKPFRLASTKFLAKIKSLPGWSPPVTADKADDSYLALGVGRSFCAPTAESSENASLFNVGARRAADEACFGGLSWDF
jgi:hypothetical protein